MLSFELEKIGIPFSETYLHRGSEYRHVSGIRMVEMCCKWFSFQTAFEYRAIQIPGSKNVIG